MPNVSAGIYLNDGQPHGGAGQSDTFTFTPASGTSDLAAFVYKLDTDASATTLAATGAKSVTLSPRDGSRTLTVQAKDRAGNLSAANSYSFSAGNAALAQPLPGATIVKRTKLQIFTPVTGYTRTYYEYRRGPGGATLPIPSANLMSATGAPITATAASPVAFSTLGGYAVWNATDTLGVVGGVVEVRARIYTATSTTPVYDTPWVRATVDSDGDGAATDDVGPGEANLLTGDLGVNSTDVDEMGLSVTRSASSRGTRDGQRAVYQYDRLGRLVEAQQADDDHSGCETRAYSYDARSNRKTRSVYGPAADGTCQQDTAATQEAHTYDSADRIVDDGYAYDAFGRTTTVPGGLTNAYYVNDRVQSQIQDDARQSWILDPAQRTRSYTTDTLVGGVLDRPDHPGAALRRRQRRPAVDRRERRQWGCYPQHARAGRRPGRHHRRGRGATAAGESARRRRAHHRHGVERSPGL